MLKTIMIRDKLTRKDFIKLAGLGVSSLSFIRSSSLNDINEFPPDERLGRICIIGRVDIKAQPHHESQTVGILYEDAVIPWLREVVAKEPNYDYFNQKWVETPDGYIYSIYLQPVRNITNQPVNSLIKTSMGQGMWAEVTIPYVDVTLVNDPSSNSWVKVRTEDGLPIRAYYGQVYYIDQIKTSEDGNMYYRVNPNYYGGNDMFWISAEAMHTITNDEISPINPEVEDKKIIIDVNKQTLSCYEGATEVYYCRVSTGWYDRSIGPTDEWGTPLGKFLISRKFISLQMNGSTTGASYDYPGIGWVSIFATGGVAIHSTFWHNNFGTPLSHGCVNALPDDAKWIFRWSLPDAAYDPGMVDISTDRLPSTTIQVIES
jgi:lipoprotein-anchoring transpeptidase ErfK/SrfK